ncbi:hypothetical protein SRA_08856 [Streptococcus ratti FA-1 = DSM 20564]|uniref:Uncharacterized protein n=1 Tax=Streptococcus ratti FA-1 = DSM 20564 TaxID=699248 RepID=A0ABP2R0J6_STRRT|nr:hypothetical protein SRA_08856 [Streptococcus ratti FA-1 = DSM 20564]
MLDPLEELLVEVELFLDRLDLKSLLLVFLVYLVV